MIFVWPLLFIFLQFKLLVLIFCLIFDNLDNFFYLSFLTI